MILPQTKFYNQTGVSQLICTVEQRCSIRYGYSCFTFVLLLVGHISPQNKLLSHPVRSGSRQKGFYGFWNVSFLAALLRDRLIRVRCCFYFVSCTFPSLIRLSVAAGEDDRRLTLPEGVHLLRAMIHTAKGKKKLAWLSFHLWRHLGNFVQFNKTRFVA